MDKEKMYQWIRTNRNNEKWIAWRWGKRIKYGSIVDPYLDCWKDDFSLEGKKKTRYIFDHSSQTEVKVLSAKVKRKFQEIDKEIIRLNKKRQSILSRNVDKMKPISNKQIYNYRKKVFKDFKEA